MNESLFPHIISRCRLPGLLVLQLCLIGCFLLSPDATVAAEPADKESGLSADTGVRALLIPRTETVLSGEISSRIETFTVDTGDRFRAGALLVAFNCSIYQAELAKAEAEQQEAEKTLEVNQRLEKLSSISDLEVAVAASRLEQARAESDIKRYQVSKCSLHAPFAGGVVKRLAAPFQYLTPGQPVLEIIDTAHIDVQIFIPSNWYMSIRQARRFTIFIEEVDTHYEGTITAVGARVDPTSQTIEIRGTITGEHPELLAGMSGVAQFPVP